jgi:NAD(P)-dependent dehydrogenase (short-subunit alcohol dehydrogenase family)
MGEVFLPLLKNSLTLAKGTPPTHPLPPPRIINITSGGGSISRRFDPNSPPNKLGMWGIKYCTSKAALNYITAAQSVVYGKEGIKIFAFSPGFVVSNLGPHNTKANGAVPAEEAARPIVKILEGERDGEEARDGFLRGRGQCAW